MQLEIALTTVTAYALAARQQGIKVVLNAAPAQTLPAALLAAVDVLVVNEGELAALVQHPASLVTNLEQLPVPCVVVTLGQRGCVARLGNNFFVQAAYPVTAVDTTGAGDTFCGVLVAALDRGESLAEAMRCACAAAALACTQAGAQASIPSAADIQFFLAKHSTSAADLQGLRAYCGLD
jgi:ribokinase